MAETIIATGVTPSGTISATGKSSSQTITAVGSVAIAGPKGDTGATGSQGPQGEQGEAADLSLLLDTDPTLVANSDSKIATQKATKTYVDAQVAAVEGSDVDSFNGRTGAVAPESGDYTAAQVTNTPAGNIAATTVQAALNELDSEKAPLSSPALTGTPTSPTATAGTNTTQIATTAFANTAAANAAAALVNAAPGTLDTLDELAAALGDDANFATTMTTALASKAADSGVVHKSGTETIDGTKSFTKVTGVDRIGGAQLNLDTTFSGNGTQYNTARIVAGSPFSGNADGWLSFWTRQHTSGTMTERMTLDSQGRIGINKTTPTVPLDVTGAIKSTSITSIIRDNGGHWLDATTRGVVGDGVTNDTTNFQAFITACGNNSKGYVPAGTYLITSRITIPHSNFELEFAPGAVIKAGASLSAGAAAYNALFDITSATSQSNVYIHGGTIDLNNQADTNAINIQGCGTNTTIWTSDTFLIENVKIINKANTTVAPSMIMINTGAVGPFPHGRVENVAIRKCVFDNGDRNAIAWFGDYLINMRIEDCDFSNNAGSTITQNGYIQDTTNGLRIQNCTFTNTRTGGGVGAERMDFTDDSRTGGRGFWFQDNDCLNNTNPYANGYAVNIHGWENVFITGNSIDGYPSAISFGASHAANFFYSKGCRKVLLANNVFENITVCTFDDDSTSEFLITDNEFRNIGYFGFNFYGEHAYTIIQNNFFYNCNDGVDDATLAAFIGATPSTIPEEDRAVIELGGNDRIIVQDNIVVDDRALLNPGADATTLTEVAGGSMGSRTYYVRITYSNSSGETLPSTELNMTVGANKLLHVRPGIPAGYASTYSTFSGIRNVNVYVGTASGNETLQKTFDYPSIAISNGWDEPTTGLVAGAAMPVANTTHARTRYGVYLLSNNTSAGLNKYSGNSFYGVTNAFGGVVDSGIKQGNTLNDTQLADSHSFQVDEASDIGISFPTPAAPVATPSSSGGTLATGTYYYSVSALDGIGESKASIETSAVVTGPTGSVGLTWTAVTGATSYRIYRSTSRRSATVYYTSATNSYTDTNAASSAGSPKQVATTYKYKLSDLGNLNLNQYAYLPGRAGGQTLQGDTASGGHLTLRSTAHATKGKIKLGTSYYDEANQRLGLVKETTGDRVGGGSLDLNTILIANGNEYNTARITGGSTFSNNAEGWMSFWTRQSGTGVLTERAYFDHNGMFKTLSGHQCKVTTTGSNLTLDTTHDTVVFTATATATLPAATGSGQTYRLICRTGTLTVDPNGAETVQGAATLALTAGQSVIITDTASGLWE